MAKLSDQIIIDLSRKVSKDVSDRILMSMALVDEPGDRFMIALSGAATVLGIAGGSAKALIELREEKPNPVALVDGLWETLRPMVLNAAGGGDAEFRKLLRHCRG